MAAGGWVVLVTEPVDGTGHAIDVTGGSWLHRSRILGREQNGKIANSG
jgi:hypothetical protein